MATNAGSRSKSVSNRASNTTTNGKKLTKQEYLELTNARLQREVKSYELELIKKDAEIQQLELNNVNLKNELTKQKYENESKNLSQRETDLQNIRNEIAKNHNINDIEKCVIDTDTLEIKDQTSH